jgi:hypothetical protein
MIDSAPLSVLDYGAIGDGITNDAVAIQAAATAAENGILYFPPGEYGLSSAITLPSNIQIFGAGAERSVIKVLGTGTNNCFNATNKTNITVSDLGFYGNSQSDASGNGLAIWVNQTVGATAVGSDYLIQNCKFENFKGDYWIYFTNDSTTYDLKNIRVLNNTFVSYAGNARNGTVPTVPSACVSIQGSTAGADTTDIVISGNIAQCTYIKSFSLLWQGVKRAVITDNIVNDAGGDASILDDAGAYAFMAYDSSGLNVPKELIYSNNIINRVKSCGLYGAGAEDLQFTNNRINDQTDSVTVTLAKGAVVVAGCINTLVQDNTIDDVVAYGIYWQSTDVDRQSSILISNNRLKNCAEGVSLVSFAGDSGTVKVSGNLISECPTAIQLHAFTGALLTNLNITDNKIVSSVASSYGIRLRSDDSSFSVSNVFISNNSVQTLGYGIYWPLVTAGPVNISNNSLIGPFATRACEVQGSTKLMLTNNSFYGQTSGGECLYTVNAQGTVRGNSFSNCSTSRILSISGGNDLGLTTPWFTPAGKGEFVQALTASEAGSAASKYVNTGWYYDGTNWVQQRTLTGN